MATQESTGTQSATVTTEHTLATVTSTKTLQLYVNISNLAAGEYVRLRSKRKLLTADSGQSIRFTEIYSWLDALVTPIVAMPPLLNGPGSAVFTLTQLNGTGRSFKWAVESA